MNLESAITFLQRLYDNPDKHNFTRLEHEALREAISRLWILLCLEPSGDSDGASESEA